MRESEPLYVTFSKEIREEVKKSLFEIGRTTDLNALLAKGFIKYLDEKGIERRDVVSEHARDFVIEFVEKWERLQRAVINDPGYLDRLNKTLRDWERVKNYKG